VSNVTFIDKTGWRLLRQMHRDGVKFQAKGLAAQTILDELTDDELTEKELSDKGETRS
jgi:hypothetical protein